uniref:Glucose-methanol-choline oxidoreductase N-terminal domain-containing protein n=1 Tax=Biomphalaria glabrata TaxID=6526 RepID=A0A2C9JQW5_BIOGL
MMALFKLLFLAIFCQVKGKDFVRQPLDYYDYIIVGAGTAGSVIASRLSEDVNVTVLLLEEGGDDRGYATVTVPAFCQETWRNPKLVRFYNSEPLPTVYQHLLNGQAQWPRGTVLGGCSSVNNMAYVRGSKHDYDRWAESIKDDGWNYQHVLSYFKKMETVTNPELRDSHYRGLNGPVGVTRSQTVYKLTDVIINAFRDVGYPYNHDYNAQSMEGVARTQHNVQDGERVSTAKGYIYPALHRHNLHLVIASRVDKVIITDRIARGVQFVQQNLTRSVYAKKEVILSAGTIGTPKLLLLSGVGPREDLKELNISVVSDLPVGHNLQDHLVFDLAVSINQSIGLLPGILNSDWAMAEWNILKKGPLTLADSGVTFHTSTTQQDQLVDWPDVKILFSLSPVATNTLRSFHYSPTLLNQLSVRDNVTNGFTFWPMLMRPESRGILKLRSTNPKDDPVIIPNYYTKSKDVETMLRAIHICKKVLQSKPMVDIQASISDVVHLNICSQFVFDSDDYWACAVLARPRTLHHISGTCKMGSKEDITAVVDSQLRVRGIQGLRVADASIMPYIVSANTNAAVIMIGEKASDLIRGESLPPTDLHTSTANIWFLENIFLCTLIVAVVTVLMFK